MVTVQPAKKTLCHLDFKTAVSVSHNYLFFLYRIKRDSSRWLETNGLMDNFWKMNKRGKAKVAEWVKNESYKQISDKNVLCASKRPKKSTLFTLLFPLNIIFSQKSGRAKELRTTSYLFNSKSIEHNRFEFGQIIFFFLSSHTHSHNKALFLALLLPLPLFLSSSCLSFLKKTERIKNKAKLNKKNPFGFIWSDMVDHLQDQWITLKHC